MPEFAKGLIIEVTDRDELEEHILENAYDPGVLMENWGNNSIPSAIHIAAHNKDEPSYYKTYDEHVNGVITWNYWNEPLINSLIEEGILSDTGKYDVTFVENQE